MSDELVLRVGLLYVLRASTGPVHVYDVQPTELSAPTALRPRGGPGIDS